MAKQNSGAGQKGNPHVTRPATIKPPRKIPMPPNHLPKRT